MSLSLPATLGIIDTVEHAIETYLASGLRPILIHAPVEGGGCTCGRSNCGKSAGKHPIAKNWQSRAATRDELYDQLARLKFIPNVGTVLGDQPGGQYLIAVDIDDADRFKMLEDELGTLPETPQCDSGRGTRLFFESPPEVDASTFVNVTGLRDEPGVDVKIKGGQVVVAPSRHQSGRTYKWSRVGPIATLPVAWALELVRTPTPKWVQSFTPQTMNADKRAKKRAEAYLETAVIRDTAALAACGEGMRNTTLHNRTVSLLSLCAGMHLGASWSYVIDQLHKAARACGLQETEVQRTIASAEKYVRESGAVRMPVGLAEPPPVERPTEASAVSTTAPTEPPPAASTPQRPVILVTSELHENVDASVIAIKSDPNLYQRDGKLVFVTRVSREESDSSPVIKTDDGEVHRQLVEGSPQIREMGISTLRERLTRVAVFQKFVGSTGKCKPILPTDAIVGAVRERGEWPSIRHIVGVVETPMLRSDGTVMQTPGYDPHTNYLYLPGESFPAILDEAATQDHAKWAFKYLCEVFHDFPYVNAAHRSVPIAAILTLVARPAIIGSVPAFLFDASTRGSGKTLQTDAIATIATGRGAPRMNYTTNEEELEKILGGYALMGSPFICLDNVPAMRPFGGGPLDRVITARDKVHLRVLGRTQVLELVWRAIVMATGNNLTCFGDTARRVIMARLEPAEENPERRTNFLHHPLLPWVSSQRTRLVSAALLLLRAYFRAGRPDMGCAQWGSFEEWARIIPHAIVFAGGTDPMLARPESDEEVDVETQALACLLEQLPKLHTKLHDLAPESVNGIGVAARTIIAALYEQSPEWPEFEPMRDAVETLCKPKGNNSPDANALGYKLRALRARPIAGRKLVGTMSRTHVMMWKVDSASAPS